MELPRESRPLDVTTIPIAEVRPGMSLIFDQGQGRQLFQVEKVGFSWGRQDDGSYRNVHTLTSGPTADGSPPWVIEVPAGARVIRILGVSAA